MKNNETIVKINISTNDKPYNIYLIQKDDLNDLYSTNIDGIYIKKKIIYGKVIPLKSNSKSKEVIKTKEELLKRINDCKSTHNYIGSNILADENYRKKLNNSTHFKYEPDKPIKVFEAFSGVGMQLMALNRLGVDYKSVGYSEIDKFAIQSYQNIHSNDNNYGDICKINGDDLPKIDLFTYSFPCTDLSKAGQQKGLSNTRSGLVYEVIRILNEMDKKNKLPKVLLMENVVDLIQTKFIKQFNEIQAELEKLGYTNHTQVLNAKDYGVAQNRQRVFMVSILGNYSYEFPKPIKLEKKLKDYLQPFEEIEEKFYLSDKALATFTDSTNRNGLVRSERFNPQTREDGDSTTRRGRVGNQQAQTLTTSCNQGVVINAKTKLCNDMLESGHLEEFDMIRHSYTSDRENDITRKENENNISATLTTRSDTLGVVTKDNEEDYIIRKLTPLECWRLMGIDDVDFYKAQEVNSNAQLYKQAGNGIVVDVLVAILRKLFKEQNDRKSKPKSSR